MIGIHSNQTYTTIYSLTFSNCGYKNKKLDFTVVKFEKRQSTGGKVIKAAITKIETNR